MSMIENDGRTIGPEPVAAPETPPEATIPEPAPEPEAESTPEQVETFDREYVEKLRKENAQWRTRARDYEDTFGELDDEIRNGWLELIRTANSGDPEAMQMLGQALGFVGDEEPQPTGDFLTREEAARIAREQAEAVWAQGSAEQQQQQAVRDVETQAKSLGYDNGTPEYIELLYFANSIDPESLNPGENLLEAADRQVKEYRQQQYDAWIASKEEEARNTPSAPNGNGVAPQISQAPKTWEEARNSLHERLSNIER